MTKDLRNLSKQVESTLDVYLKELDSSYFKQGTKVIEYRWVKCIELIEDFEEIKNIFPKFVVFSIFGHTSSRNVRILKLFQVG